ncbi:MAG: signal peptidase I [Synechococcus sp.]|nr:signal peptidase I [Synechococcus sp.]
MTNTSDTPESSWSRWRGLLLVVGLALLIRWGVMEPRWIPSESMHPSLEPQDRVLVFKLGQRLGLTPNRNAVVVFRTPEALIQAGYDPNAALIKRVVALPGDEIAVENGSLVRNGETVLEPWIAAAMEYTLPARTIRPGELLVLGDNRNASLDSHLWGPLPEADLIGTAVWRYWPLAGFGPIRAPRLG